MNTPDTPLLRRAVDAARQAMALDPELPDAHATLAFMLVSANRIEEARAAGRRAVALDPTYWAHHFRLGHAAWGDERLRAHAEALSLYPDFAFAHFQIAMVHIARNELPLAEQTLRQGIVVRERHQQSSERFPARGLHWLLGLVLLAREDDAQAARQFERELASAGGRLYAREFSIAAHNGLGFIALKKGDAVDAADRFRQALARYDGHARSHFGLAAALAALGEKEAAGDRTRGGACGGRCVGEGGTDCRIRRSPPRWATCCTGWLTMLAGGSCCWSRARRLGSRGGRFPSSQRSCRCIRATISSKSSDVLADRAK